MSEASPPSPIGARKRLAFSLVTLVGVLLVVEVLARVGSYVAFGLNPYYLFYGYVGWKAEVDGHTDEKDGYFKFPAHAVFTSKEVVGSAHINSRGFRGPDFTAEKPDGVYRVISLGASSTFGYKNRDETTYPYYLQQIFEAKAPHVKVEAINGGIAHLNTQHIRSMFEHEIIGYEPDAVTFYEGFNDATFLVVEGPFARALHWIDGHVATYAVTRKVVGAVGVRLYKGKDPFKKRLKPAELEKERDRIVARFRGNIEDLIQRAKGAGIDVILMRQAFTVCVPWSDICPTKFEERSLTRAEELAMMRAALAEEGELHPDAAVLYFHHALMKEVDRLAEAHGLTVIDNIANADAHPTDTFLSPVHLHPNGNQRLAEALYEVLLPRVETKLGVTRPEAPTEEPEGSAALEP